MLKSGWLLVGIGGKERRGRTVHLVVHYDAGFGDHELAAEDEVDSGG